MKRFNSAKICTLLGVFLIYNLSSYNVGANPKGLGYNNQIASTNRVYENGDLELPKPVETNIQGKANDLKSDESFSLGLGLGYSRFSLLGGLPYLGGFGYHSHFYNPYHYSLFAKPYISGYHRHHYHHHHGEFGGYHHHHHGHGHTHGFYPYHGHGGAGFGFHAGIKF